MMKDTEMKRRLQESQKESKTSFARGADAVAAVVPYELDDVMAVFKDLIDRRGGSVDDLGSDDVPVTDGSQALSNQAAPSSGGRSQVRMVRNVAGLDELIKSSKRGGKLLVLNFSAQWCGPCQTFAPTYEGISKEHIGSAFFAKVDIDDAGELAMKYDVSSIPVTKIFVDGRIAAEVAGGNGSELRKQIRELKAKISPPPPPPPSLPAVTDRPPENTGAGGNNNATGLTKVNTNTKTVTNAPKVRIIDNNDDDDDDLYGGDDDLEERLWFALEQACAEKGYTPEQMKDMLESPDFPPEEIMRLVMDKTGSKDAGRVKGMLSVQRKAVLEKVKANIKEAQRVKSEQEQIALERVRAIGRCPAGFEWFKCEGGYRCGGGSHFVTEAEINYEEIMTAKPTNK